MISFGTFTNGSRPPRSATAEIFFLTPSLNPGRTSSPDITIVCHNESSAIGNWGDNFVSMDRLQEGWDGYAAAAPSKAAQAAAKNFLSSLIKRGFQPSRLAPSVIGGVGMTRWNGEREVYVEFYNDGGVHALFTDGVGDPISREVRLGHQPFVELIEEMREYLDG